MWMMLTHQSAISLGPFDACPFILPNFVLSRLGALNASIITMHQRRQETKDRIRAGNGLVRCGRSDRTTGREGKRSA